MEASCEDPESIGMGWVQDGNLLDVFRDKVGILL
jgi:hypothetical protein